MTPKSFEFSVTGTAKILVELAIHPKRQTAPLSHIHVIFLGSSCEVFVLDVAEANACPVAILETHGHGDLVPVDLAISL
jgi:hypothetical protein